jgi:hypothetical protein
LLDVVGLVFSVQRNLRQDTKGPDPIVVRIRSADRSPRVSSLPDVTAGCLCRWDCHPSVAITTIVAHIGCEEADRTRSRR